MKTLKELNERMWYRLIKLLFLIAFIVACTVAIVAQFTMVGNHQTDFEITCNYGNRDVFLAYNDKQIYVPFHHDYTDDLTDLPDNIKVEIQNACGISREEMIAMMKAELEDGQDWPALFSIREVDVNVFTSLTAAMWSLLSILCIAVVFEIIRRSFYYVVLGTINPPNAIHNPR
jgi:hypothetical protein